jgi:hypothetical protein
MSIFGRLTRKTIDPSTPLGRRDDSDLKELTDEIIKQATDEVFDSSFKKSSFRDHYWAVTCHFNPAGYDIKKENYHRFRQSLGMKLLTVELSYNGKYELEESDADHLIRVRVRPDSVMWHKENLLNIGIAALPSTCDRVCVVDADVVFSSKTWIEDTYCLLNRKAVIQPFDRVWRLTQQEDLNYVMNNSVDAKPTNTGIYGQFEIGWCHNICSNGYKALERWPGSPGFAWCFKRELLKDAPLFDRMIVGGGDVLIAIAAFGQFDGVVDPTLGYGTTTMSAITRTEAPGLLANCYSAWAKRFHAVSQRLGGVGWYGQPIYHLWHGDRENRRYGEKAQMLSDFDPYHDVGYNHDQVLEWRRNKPELRQRLCRYFDGRMEDRLPGDHAANAADSPLSSKRRIIRLNPST